MKKQFIMVLYDGFTLFTFADLMSAENVRVFDFPCKTIHNRILKFLRKIHVHRRINNHINLPFKSIWGSALEEINWDSDTEYYIIFLDPYPLKTSYLAELKKKHNIKYIWYIAFVWDEKRDKLSSKYLHEVNFDYIFTLEPRNVDKHNFMHYPYPYSMICDNRPAEIEQELYLVANASKGRLQMFHDVYRELRSSQLTMLYRLVHVPTSMQEFRGEIVYNEPIPYSIVVEEVKKSNCILEVVESKQTAPSLRYYEAICYNKKLLTNNKYIVNYPYYNPNYMQIFEKPEDIDIEWVKERSRVDYHYDGRYSPIHFIDRIIELEKQKEAQSGEEEK